jgi:exodeoxyribonuclease-5
MTTQELHKILLQHFPFETNTGQRNLLIELSEFISGNNGHIFLLKGYAGTGKTTIVRTLVKTLPILKAKTFLLAPTGRAAKVLTNYTKQQAFTIHKKIYGKHQTYDGAFVFQLRPNMHSDTLFVVDEASMIAHSGGLNSNGSSVLDDLMSYVFSGNNCKLLLIGDTAQLPPVGLDISPALDAAYLKASYHYDISQFELTEVMRQNEHSGILVNATAIRNKMKSKDSLMPHFILNKYKDVIRINGDELEDEINNAYNNFGVEDTMIICRSNKRANIFNQQIRARIRWQENELSSGDYMMVVKNNYFWLPEESKAGFIANGDIIQLMRIGKIQEMHGFRFADARIKMIDYPDEPTFDTRLLLDTIMSDSPALSNEDNKRLYESVLADYSDIGNKKERIKKVKEDMFFNALQVKFSYAITCHKAQGGQWPCVFVEQGYLTNEMINLEYLRWLYTAVSRASSKLYLVNFNKDFF